MTAETLEPGAHHQRVRLAAEVGLLAGGHLDGRDERAARRGDAVFDGAGKVGVRADELCARKHEIRRLRERVERIVPPLADDHIIGVHVVHRDARVIERVQKARLADDVGRAARRLVTDERRRCERARIKPRLRHVQPHAGELLLELERRAAAVVRKKEIFLTGALQPVDKLRHAGENFVAVIDHAVHIADIAFFVIKIQHCIPPCNSM